MKKIIIACCVLGTVLQIYAQGYVVTNGITFYDDTTGWGTAIYIMHGPSFSTNSSYTGFNFTPSYKLPPYPLPEFPVNTSFTLNILLDQGVRIFSMQAGDSFTLQGIQSGAYNELTVVNPEYPNPLPVITCDEGDVFYLGFYTGGGFFDVNGNYPNPVLGWGEFENVNGTIEMLGSGLESGGEGIYVGTLNIINVPEPTTCALCLFGLAGFLGCRRR